MTSMVLIVHSNSRILTAESTNVGGSGATVTSRTFHNGIGCGFWTNKRISFASRSHREK